MKILAVSGGPDSMFLLDWYKRHDVVIAHVNYHKRKDSDIDEKIVRDFAKEHNIKIEVLNVKEKPKGNFQSWARKVRYDFFKKIYEKYNADKLLMAHHRDDFLETALMQQRSGRTPRYFGIRKKNVVDGMNIYRPFVNLYWKAEIIDQLQKDNIEFVIDSSNSQPIFERNKIRIELLEKTVREKKSIFNWFKMSNKILKKKFKRVDSQYDKWKKSEFDVRLFRKLRDKEEVIFEYINDSLITVKLSKGKIESLVSFIVSPNGGKTFKLNDLISIEKKDNKLNKK